MFSSLSCILASDITKDFLSTFPNEEACRNHLFALRWPSGFECPVCGHSDFYSIGTRHLYECRKCGRQTSVTAGTVMHRTRVPLQAWFLAIHLMSSGEHGRSVMSIHRAIGVSYPTAWTMCGKIRSAMREQDAPTKLAGVMQIDVDSFGAQKSSGANGRPSADRIPGCVAMSIDTDGNPDKLIIRLTDVYEAGPIKSVLREFVSSESILEALHQLDDYFTPKKRSYRFPFHSYMDDRLIRKTIRRVNQYVADRYRGRGIKHLQACLDEFCYRFNKQFRYPVILKEIFAACINGSVNTYADLIA